MDIKYLAQCLNYYYLHQNHAADAFVSGEGRERTGMKTKSGDPELKGKEAASKRIGE